MASRPARRAARRVGGARLRRAAGDDGRRAPRRRASPTGPEPDAGVVTLDRGSGGRHGQRAARRDEFAVRARPAGRRDRSRGCDLAYLPQPGNDRRGHARTVSPTLATHHPRKSRPRPVATKFSAGTVDEVTLIVHEFISNSQHAPQQVDEIDPAAGGRRHRALRTPPPAEPLKCWRRSCCATSRRRLPGRLPNRGRAKSSHV